jgi:two-component system chemotaxis response regulator CheY
MKILIADDDRMSRESHKQIVSLFGNVDAVVNGAEAVQQFTNALDIMDPYHFIFLDIRMPFFNGEYALEKIREIETSRHIPKNQKVKVIIVTSSQARRDVLKFKDMCDGYLLKPIPINRIKKILDGD